MSLSRVTFRALVVSTVVAACARSSTPSRTADSVPSTFAPRPATSGEPSAFARASDDAGLPALGPAGRRALDNLRKATVFESAYVGDGGSLSESAAAVRALLREPSALEAFQELFDRGSPVGRLYALVAFWYLRPQDFRRMADSLRATDGDLVVETLQGCIGGRERIGDLLQARSGDALRLPPGTGAYAFMCNRKSGPFVADIVGGVVPIDIVEGLQVIDDRCAARPPLPPHLMPR